MWHILIDEMIDMEDDSITKNSKTLVCERLTRNRRCYYENLESRMFPTLPSMDCWCIHRFSGVLHKKDAYDIHTHVHTSTTTIIHLLLGLYYHFFIGEARPQSSAMQTLSVD